MFVNEKVPLAKPGRNGKVMSRLDLELLLRVWWDFNSGKSGAVPFDWDSVVCEMIENSPDPTNSTSKLKTDLKVKGLFGSENTTVYGRGENIIRKTSSGIPYIIVENEDYVGCSTCWILYCDGKEFRGYVPTRGNCFNRDTMTLFGEDRVSDITFLLSDLGITLEEAEDIVDDNFIDLGWNLDEVIRDFDSRIIPC